VSEKLIKICATFFGLGYLPYAPGTFGSAAGLLVYLWVINFLPLYLLMTALILILGLVVCQEAEKIFAIKDPPQVVIDEVAGMLIALLFLPVSFPVVFCAFVLFRGFDTVKIWPIDKLEKVPFGIGIMLDDIMAGIYTNLVMRIALMLVGIGCS